MKQKIQIIWWKRNLRIDDNEILSSYDPRIPILGVYFFEPAIIVGKDFSEFHLKFIIESLLELQRSLLTLNIPLLLLPYDAVDGFQELQKYFHISNIFSHEETGNSLTYTRDKNVLLFCKKNAIGVLEFPTNGVVRRLQNRDHWQGIWTKRMRDSIFTAQKAESMIEIPKKLGNISKMTKRYYKNYISHPRLKHIQKGGESVGKKILENFLEGRSRSYMYDISKPLQSEQSCSRLSPYIAYGCLSLKYISQQTLKRQKELRALNNDAANNHAKSLTYFLSRLHWQSHFVQKLEMQPEIEYQNICQDFDSIRQYFNEELFQQVLDSRSGIPYIDALMRQIHKTGWCNFRSRAVLTSFLCNTLQFPWQIVAPRIAKLWTDYEPGIHYSQFQMQSGTTGINTIRIYNPIYNGKQKDPEGKFIYKYLPELKNVPKKFIHEPYLWEGFGQLNYPKPIVDIKSANKKISEILWSIKGSIDKEVTNKILEKHASRTFKQNRVLSHQHKLSQEDRTIRKKRKKIADIQASLF